MFDECVCGCPRVNHRPVQMSVPLTKNRPPLYPLPQHGAYNNITYVWPASSYERDECSCGRCCTYESDNSTV